MYCFSIFLNSNDKSTKPALISFIKEFVVSFLVNSVISSLVELFLCLCILFMALKILKF